MNKTLRESKITIKLDKRGRLCGWKGNVQNLIFYDRHGQLVVTGNPALFRTDDPEIIKAVWEALPRESNILHQGFAVVIPMIIPLFHISLHQSGWHSLH